MSMDGSRDCANVISKTVDGNWIMVGLLHQLAGRPRLAETCDKILTHLAPLNADAGKETARLQYKTMDINLRTLALQTICACCS